MAISNSLDLDLICEAIANHESLNGIQWLELITLGMLDPVVVLEMTERFEIDIHNFA